MNSALNLWQLRLRRVAERLSRTTVLRRRLPAEFGGSEIYVSPGASLRYWRRNLSRVDPMLFRVAKAMVKPRDVVWDVGANVGLFTMAAAFLSNSGGKVLSIEPDFWLADLIRRSVAIRNGPGAVIDVLPAAVSESTGLSHLNIAERGRAANFLDGSAGSTQSGGVRNKQLVQTVTLDWLFEHYAAPDFVKIDVEGLETSVLRGGQNLLEQARPVLLIECSGDGKELTTILRGHGYDLYDAHQDLMGQPIESVAWDTLAVPQSR